MYIFLNVYAYLSPARGKILVLRYIILTELWHAKTWFSTLKSLLKFSSDQYLSSYVVAEILMETWNRCTNEHAIWMKGKELKKKKWKKRKEKKRKNVLYSQHIDLSWVYILIESIFPYRFYVVSGSITWWWVWNIYKLISSKLDTYWWLLLL